MATLASVVWVFAIQALVLINADELKIDVAPTLIKVGTTSALDVKCTVLKNSDPGVRELTSIKLHRYPVPGDDDSQLLAVVTKFTSDVKVKTEEKISTEGEVQQTGESFLSVGWEHPTAIQGGEYVCQAYYTDADGIISLDASRATVTAEGATLMDVFEKMKRNEKQISLLKKETKNVARVHHADLIGSYEDSDYYLSMEGVDSVTRDQEVCKSYGGKLAEVNDANEHNAIKGFLNALTGIDWVMIGGSDEAAEGTWVYPSTGQPIAYITWWSYEPDNDRSENCLWLGKAENWRMAGDKCVYATITPEWRYLCETPRQ